MVLLFCYGVVIVVALLIHREKERQRRIDEDIDWIVNSEKRWNALTGGSDFLACSNADDEVIIEDLHTDGFIVVDESKGHKERFDC